jgi:ferredoxin-type protein NapH
MKPSNEAAPIRLAVSAGVAATLWGLGLLTWRLSGSLAPLIFFGYLGSVLAPALALYLGTPRGKRIRKRWVVTVAIGVGLFAAALARVAAQQSLVQVEGLVFELLAGVFGAATLHFLLAKLLGPLLFGRIYCGWACWTAVFLDLLPYKHSDGRLGGLWPHLRYIHLAASVALVSVLALGFAYRPGPLGAYVWFLGGNALYYLLGVGLAFGLKDNRAFCKYACPAGLLAKPAARFALLKVRGDPTRCNGKLECLAVCPMDIKVADYTRQHLRVLSTECILCQNCINVCAEGSLSLSFGLESRGVELLRER